MSFGQLGQMGEGFGKMGGAVRKILKRIVINGIFFERSKLDGQYVTIDGKPVYMEIDNG